MGFLYVAVRTYPFWAIPLAIALFNSCTGKNGEKISKGRKRILLFLGVTLCLSSIAFFVFGGPMEAVPTVYEVLRESGLLNKN